MILGGQSLWAFAEDCTKDNRLTFKTGGVAIMDEGATKCEPDDEQTETTSWKIIDNDTKIILDGDTASLIELTSSSLKIGVDEDGTSLEVHYKK